MTLFTAKHIAASDFTEKELLLHRNKTTASSTAFFHPVFVLCATDSSITCSAILKNEFEETPQKEICPSYVN